MFTLHFHASARRRASATDEFRSDVLRGLAGSPKSIPCKHLYDKRGSELFDRICNLDEYYVTRTEIAIMRANAESIARELGECVRLIEYGSGSSIKTRLLLDHLRDVAAYVPVDVSQEHLSASCARLRGEYLGLRVQPLFADFTRPLSLPPAPAGAREVVYFPGSTIGNLVHEHSLKLLRQTSKLCGPTGAMLVGIDLQKDPGVIQAAYNDSQRVTEQFNLNLLRRINRDLDGDFEEDQFEFRAVYNPRLGRVESSLVSLCEQEVLVDRVPFGFAEGEHLRTEYSHKYTLPQFERLAQEGGFGLSRVWTDPREYFAVVLLTAA